MGCGALSNLQSHINRAYNLIVAVKKRIKHGGNLMHNFTSEQLPPQIVVIEFHFPLQTTVGKVHFMHKTSVTVWTDEGRGS